MASIRLISDDVFIHYPNLEKSDLIKENNYVLRAPAGRFLTLCFSSHLEGSKKIHPFISEAIENNIGVVYICEALPENPIIDEHVVYIECPYRWYIHTLFMNPLQFRAVFSDHHSDKLARAFSEFTKYEIPRLRTLESFQNLVERSFSDKNNILVEITGGVGDHLMTIPSLKTLASQGKKVHILCERHRVDCFQNLPYLTHIYTDRRHVDVSRFEKIIMLHFGQILNDYRSDLNKQNRIFSVAALCGLEKNSLVIQCPEIIFTAEEIEAAKRKWGVYPNKIFFGFDSDRADAKMSESFAQEKINALKAKGFTVFTSSLRKYNLKNCIDLTHQLSLRDMFALIAVMDFVVTIDTAFLHVAGALEKKTFALMNYFDPSWRCSTYKNCHPLIPNVSCHPCVGKQFVSSQFWQCKDRSCYSHFNWEYLYRELCQLKLKLKPILKVPEQVNVSDAIFVEDTPIDEFNEPKTLLIYDRDGLGDILMMTPTLAALAKRGYIIDVVTKCGQALQNLPYVRRTFNFPDIIPNKRGYNKIVDVSYKLSQYEFEWCRQHRLLASASLFKLNPKELGRLRPEIILMQEELDLYTRFFQTEKKVLAVCFTSADSKRAYPREKRQGFINAISENFPDLEVIIVGDTAGDEGWTVKKFGVKKSIVYQNCLDLRGKTSVRELFSIINRSDYCISVDTAVLHIAGAFEKPSIFLPSAINADWRKYPETRVIIPRISCYPCNERNCRCNGKHKSAECVESISIHRVVSELRRMLYDSKISEVTP